MDQHGYLSNKGLSDFNKLNEKLAKYQPIDCKITVELGEANLLAYIHILPPENGGNDIDKEQILEALERERIKYGIDYETIDNIVELKLYYQKIVIAKGLPAVRGKNGEIIDKYPKDKILNPTANLDGTVNYRDLGLITNITKGSLISEIILPTDGEVGYDVLGREIIPLPGKPANVQVGSNIRLTNDGRYLICTADGHVVYRNHCFHVETSLVIKEDVNSNTGNIDFIGDIVIKGNVFEGFTVESGNNIIIHGMCEGAKIISKGNTLIKLGAVNSEIHCEGSLKLDYAENCKIHCKGDLKASSLVYTQAYIEGDLDCSSKPGTIMGGVYQVVGNTVANTIGYKTYCRTSIIAGNTALIVDDYNKLMDEIEELDAEIEMLSRSIEHLNQRKKESNTLPEKLESYLKNYIRFRIQKNIERGPMVEKAEELNQKINDSDKVTIKVRNHLYANVRVSIGPYCSEINQEYGKCTLTPTEDGIMII